MVKKFAGIALCSAVLIGGTLVLATNPKDPSTPKPPADKPKLTSAFAKQPVLPHDKDIRTYLKSVASFMEVPPRDGFFGVSRVPTIHGKNQNAVPGYEQVISLGKTYDFLSGAIGKNPHSENYDKQPSDLTVTQKMRMAMMHRVAPPNKYVLYRQVIYQDVLNEASKVAEKTPDADGYTASVVELQKHKLNIMAKVVKATDDSCTKCHQGVKKGEPIGHVFAMYTEVK